MSEEGEVCSDQKNNNDIAELVDIPFRAKHQASGEEAAAVYRELCEPLKGRCRMLLGAPPSVSENRALIDDDGSPSPSYDMGPERGGKVTASLRIMSDPPGTFDKTVPLRMIPYKVPKDSRMCFDIAACRAADEENERIQEHNRYVTSLLSLFISKNGCSTSAGHVTLPPPPENLMETRTKRLGEIFKNKYAATILAVRYLHQHAKTCEVDYNVEDAVDAANDVAFDEAVKAKTAKGKFRFRLPGSKPAYWSGNSDERDSMGRRVKWAKGKTHSFISAEVSVELANDELVKS